MMKLWKKGLSLFLVLACAGVFPMAAHAAEETVSSESAAQPVDGSVVRVDVPDENGNYITLEGEEAKQWYNQAVIETKKNLIEDEIIIHSISKEDHSVTLDGMFTYKYRYVESKHTNDVARTDLKKNITNKLTNQSSVEQSYDLRLSVSQSWTINGSVTGKYKDAVTGQLGGNWGKSYSKDETLHVKIAPGKTVQVQFVPIMDKSVGEAQKYYIPRGGLYKNPIIEKRVAVTTYNPKFTTCKVGIFNMKTVYGAYIWVEK